MNRLYWNLRTPITGKDSFLASSQWDCPYIIRVNKDNTYSVYDYRMHANMSTIDFNYFSYSRMSNKLKHLTSAQKLVRKLYKQARKGD